MYVVHHEYETENGKIVFETYQILFDGILICECERKSEADDIARKLNSHDVLTTALEAAKLVILDANRNGYVRGNIIMSHINDALSLAKST